MLIIVLHIIISGQHFLINGTHCANNTFLFFQVKKYIMSQIGKNILINNANFTNEKHAFSAEKCRGRNCGCERKAVAAAAGGRPRLYLQAEGRDRTCFYLS